MELAEVVRRRRMVRRYTPEPMDPAAVERLLAAAQRAPSAGFSQGWGFLVLDTPRDVDRFWEVTTPPARAASPDAWLRGMRTAPVVIVPFSSQQAYLDRYAEPDKGWTDRDVDRWPVPYWHVDAGMAALLVLLTAVDEGLGACFFGVPGPSVAALRREFGVPDAFAPVGALTVGHPAQGERAGGSAGRRRRRPQDEVVHRGHWSA
ncbi:nitroreductase family protein [Actinotalea subterranea]|uniref:nitroreductase family protein n=1 Tax=Actinotalea subterranea TaxID=2607497 RepID=UPI0011EF6A0D|nr:nitroreductase family protein [Actinotalea subterranea]